MRLVDAHDGREGDFHVDAALSPEVGHWTNYPMTVARRLSRNFGALDHGADVAFCGTLPRAAGLSTSSALITAVFLVMAGVNRLEERTAFMEAIPTIRTWPAISEASRTARPLAAWAATTALERLAAARTTPRFC